MVHWQMINHQHSNVVLNTTIVYYHNILQRQIIYQISISIMVTNFYVIMVFIHPQKYMISTVLHIYQPYVTTYPTHVTDECNSITNSTHDGHAKERNIAAKISVISVATSGDNGLFLLQCLYVFISAFVFFFSLYYVSRVMFFFDFFGIFWNVFIVLKNCGVNIDIF